MFDAWLHAEAGLTFLDLADYSPQEIQRLQLGFMLRNQPAEGRDTTSASEQKRKIRSGQKESRQEMLKDVGVH